MASTRRVLRQRHTLLWPSGELYGVNATMILFVFVLYVLYTEDGELYCVLVDQSVPKNLTEEPFKMEKLEFKF